MTIKPDYEKIHDWEFYTHDILTEYKQCVEEGLEIEQYKELFEAIAKLPKSEISKDFGDVIFKAICSAKIKSDYPYTEPSDLEEIRTLRKPFPLDGTVDYEKLEGKLRGAWLGRTCGCMLGKTVEGVRSDELTAFLKQTNNYPMHRYMKRVDATEEICKDKSFGFMHTCYVDDGDGMPVDDDTNYTVLAQIIIEKYGRNFTPDDVAHAWLDYQPKNAYCTAERVAFCNFVKGYRPPESAVYQNPYREWIGAQIRGDYFGYINPGNPELAAEMAWRDASISHVKNGIYGEMFIAAMLAAAAVTNDTEKILRAGLAQIPSTSRLYEAIKSVIEKYHSGLTQAQMFDYIYKCWPEESSHSRLHTISNAMIVAAALLYGNGDYGKSICIAVEAAFDTDCNAATVGSIVGLANGADAIDKIWSEPINDTLHTSIFGVGTVKISEMAKKTLSHLE